MKWTWRRGNYFRAEKEKSSPGCRKRSSRSCIYNLRDKLILTTVIIIKVKNNKTVLKKELRLCRLVNSALECYDAQLKPWTSIVSSLLLYFKRLRKRYNVQTECRDRDTRFRFQNPLEIWYYFHTSTESALHVESPWVVYEVLRPGFFRPVVQLANMFANDKIVALASDILAA